MKKSSRVVPDSHAFTVPGSDRIYDRRKLLAVVLVPLMMALMQISSVNNALPALREALHSSDSGLQWVLSGYALAIGIVLVPAGRLGDMLGRSSLFVVGLGTFTVASLACALAPNVVVLNMFRIMQGVGGGILSPQTTGLIVHYFTGQARSKAFGLFGLTVSVSVAIGPLLSGALIAWFGNNLGWRGGFFLNVPLGIIGLLLAFSWLPFGKERRLRWRLPRWGSSRQESSGQESSRQSAKIDIDLVGSGLLSISVLFVMLPFMSRGILWTWVFLPLGIIIGAVWVRWEKSYKARGKSPMMDLALLKIRSYSLGTLTGSLFFLSGPAIMVITIIYLQNGVGVSAIHVGLLILPNAAASALGSLWGGNHGLIHGVKLLIGSATLLMLSTIALGFTLWQIDHGASILWAIIPLIANGFAFGSFGSTNQTQAMLDVPPANGGTAGGFLQTGQRVATAIGIAMVTGTFFAGQTINAQHTAAGELLPNWMAGIACGLGLVVVLNFVTVLSALSLRRR